jgi:hypothetical protein
LQLFLHDILLLLLLLYYYAQQREEELTAAVEASEMKAKLAQDLADQVLYIHYTTLQYTTLHNTLHYTAQRYTTCCYTTEALAYITCIQASTRSRSLLRDLHMS